MHLKKIIIEAESFPAADRYPFTLEILKHTREIPLTTPVTFFAGENGTGKSTLLEAVARRCNIQIWDGEQRMRLHGNPYEKMLPVCLSVEWQNGPVPGSFFASEIFRHFAQLLDEWAVDDPAVLDYFGSQSLMEKSHGQSHLAFFKTRYTVRGLYFLDEPENALSPRSQLELRRVLHRAGKNGEVQFIIATHSPLLLSLPGATIFSFDQASLQSVACEDTDHYRVYRDFFLYPERFSVE
ncbi:MAG: AAA family ATPase [Desulfosudaceae bacterium]